MANVQLINLAPTSIIMEVTRASIMRVGKYEYAIVRATLPSIYAGQEFIILPRVEFEELAKIAEFINALRVSGKSVEVTPKYTSARPYVKNGRVYYRIMAGVSEPGDYVILPRSQYELVKALYDLIVEKSLAVFRLREYLKRIRV